MQNLFNKIRYNDAKKMSIIYQTYLPYRTELKKHKSLMNNLVIN